MEVVKEQPVENIKQVRSLDAHECRICLKYCEQSYDLFQNDEDIPRKIMAFAAIQIEHGDGLPRTICFSCRHQVDTSYDFKCQVEKSDATLRKILVHELNTNENEKETFTRCVDSVISEAITDELPRDEVANHESEMQIHHSEPSEENVSNLGMNNFTVNQALVTYHMMTNCDIVHEAVIDKDMLEDCHESEMLADFVDTKEDISSSEITHTSEVCPVLLEEQDQPKVVINESRESQAKRMNNGSIKLEELSLPEETPFSDGEDNTHMEELIFHENDLKFEVKRNSVSEGEEDCNGSREPNKINVENLQNSEENNDSDEEKPLICRTQRQKCPHCIKTFATKSLLQRHMAIHKHKTKLRYVCYLCDKQFSNVAKLKTHVSNNHDSLKNDTRIDTDDNFGRVELEKKTEGVEKSGSSGATEKQKLDKKSLKFKCTVCTKQFTYQKSFMSHMKTHANNSLSDNSEHHSEQLEATVELLGNHTDSSNSKMNESEDDDLPLDGLQCTQCGKLFATKRNLKRHISTHSGLRFNCSACSKEFSRLDKLKEHEQSKHKDEIFDQSDEDDDDSENDGRPNDGTESRRKEKKCRPHQCTLCPKAFAQPQSLANHLERHKRVKEPQKRFLCEVCSKCFAQSGSLVAHMRTHTGIKPYVCNVCTRAFTKSTYLQLHLRTHSGEKPYICQYCSRAFARANTLARHITMHTGEAKYHCQICMKSFRRLTSLNEHTYTHTGQRPYACKICSKRYNNAGSLYAHTKKCRVQQLSGSTANFTVSVDNSNHHSNNSVAVPQMLVYTQRKILPNEPQVTQGPTPQYMITTVQGQKPLSTNINQSFAVAEPHFYALDGKQFKNSYYTIYPNM